VVQYQSTRGHKETISFEDVILSGLAPDKGLYLPDSLTIDNLNHLTEEDLSYEDFVKTIFIALDKNSAKYVDDLSLYSGFENSAEPVLKDLNDTTLIMELFHGPTKSFKDYALQPLGAIADKRLSELGERGLVLVATSGDTGSAAIQAVKESENIDIVVLHPADKISDYQRQQMTSVIKDNVLNIAVNGSYDDCQRIAKEILSDNPFERRIISLNSINWLRVMGQVSYYVWLTNNSHRINVAFHQEFWHAYSAWFGRSHGLKINQIMCTTNVNDVLKRFTDTGTLEPLITKPSVAPSMDIQIPSSLERLIYDLENDSASFYTNLKKDNKSILSENGFEKLQQVFSSKTYDDDNIKNEIVSLNEKFNIIFDPHTVTSVRMALDTNSNIPTVAIGTASPEKFSNVISPIVEDYPEISLDHKEEFINLDKNSDEIVQSIKDKFE